MPKILIPGQVPFAQNAPPANDYIEINQTYDIVPRTRDGKAKITAVDTRKEEVISLQFEDGGEWIGRVGDLEEIFGYSLRSEVGLVQTNWVRAMHVTASISQVNVFIREGKHQILKQRIIFHKCILRELLHPLGYFFHFFTLFEPDI